MRRALWAGLIAGWVAMPLAAGETYSLMFRPGALDDIAAPSGETLLAYDARVTGPTAGGGAESFRIVLASDGGGETVVTRLDPDGERRLGAFPTGAGNPIIMYFMETTLRQVADLTGGSPFYLRNRIKEALRGQAEIVPATVTLDGHEIAARRVTIHPFAAIAERDRMGPLGDLAVSVTVGEAIPGWYSRLDATTPASGSAAKAGTMPFSSTLVLSVQGVEDAE